MNEKLTSIVAETFLLDEQEVQDDLERESVEMWDSLNHLRLITAVEEAFGIKLAMSQIESIGSVADLRVTVESHLGQS